MSPFWNDHMLTQVNWLAIKLYSCTDSSLGNNLVPYPRNWGIWNTLTLWKYNPNQSSSFGFFFFFFGICLEFWSTLVNKASFLTENTQNVSRIVVFGFFRFLDTGVFSGRIPVKSRLRGYHLNFPWLPSLFNSTWFGL